MPEKIGKFKILKTLGNGSMGEVFLAVDEVLGRQVAIKTMLPSTSFGAEAQARFAREAKATAGMNHPNIVTAFDFGEQDGLHYLVMEFVEGQDLENLIKQGTLPKAELLEALAQTCEGLAYAHERGIIHRDVKPGNILVTQQGNRIQAKLTDFGVALVDRSNLTDDGVWMGTVSYMAPEYLDTGKASPSSDLFAVGVMLYEVLTGGRKPFTGETTTGILNAILRKAVEPMTPQETENLTSAILEVTQKALSKTSEDRYLTGEALAQAIRSAVAVPASVPPKSATTPVAEMPLVVGKGKGATCLSLRVALRQALPGAHIKVMPGLYRESLVIDKDITISALGEAFDVHLESPQGPCIHVEACSATLRGFSFQQVSGNSSPLVLVGTGQVTLEGCHLKGGPDATLTIPGAPLKDANGLGLKLDLGAMATLENCELTDLWAGAIEVGPDARVHAQRCKMHGSEFAGLLALEKSSAVLEECDLSGHAGSGLHAIGGANVELRNCRIKDNAGYGLSVVGASILALNACEIARNGHAWAFIHRDATAQLTDCKIFDGRSADVICSEKDRGVLDGCQTVGNAKSGAEVEPGGSLQLVRCVIGEGHDSTAVPMHMAASVGHERR